MLNRDEIHQIWAPPEALWSRWVKPVLFAFMDGVFEVPPARAASFETDWVPAAGTTAIIVDLPGDEGVLWGIQLAQSGYRPIPLYNALPFPLNAKMSAADSRPLSVVDVEPILAALCREATALQQISLANDAPPAFLLDAARRVARFDPAPGRFDNRSVCFSTDFPSAEFLQTQGIRKAIIVQENTNVAGDLVQVLLSWQRSGIQLFRRKSGEAGPATPVVVERPSFLRTLWYRISVMLGLRRGELGGFGAIVPSSGG
jgi:hypothetical protein